MLAYLCIYLFLCKNQCAWHRLVKGCLLTYLLLTLWDKEKVLMADDMNKQCGWHKTHQRRWSWI